jgi:hypothetical protein
MKRLIVSALVACAAMSGAASAETIESWFGNTLTVTDANGASRFHFNEDGSYTMIPASGASVSGAWAVQGAQICLTPVGQAQACYPLEAGHAVGDAWTVATGEGQSATVALSAGR